MKITGPGQPPAPSADALAPKEGVAAEQVGGVGGADPALGPSEAGRAFAEKLAGTEAVRSPESASVASADKIGVRDLAADLEAGRVDARAALDHVIARLLDLQVGANAPAAVRAQVESALRDALETDPVLVAKLRELG